MSCKELLDGCKMAEGTPVLEVLGTADLTVDKARAKVFIEEEELVSQLLENGLNALSSVAFGVDLGEKLSAQEAQSVDKLKVAVLIGNIVLIILVFLGKSGSIFLLLSLTFFSQLLLLKLKLSFALVEQQDESHGKDEI